MKTPREILSERHQSANAKLDALRQRVVAEQLAVPSAERTELRHSAFNPSFIMEKLWTELILPCRRLWIGLAAIWTVLICFNFGESVEMPKTAIAKISPPSPEVLAALKEQKQMMTQMLGPMASPPARSNTPGPRSQQRDQLSAA